jgi:hypothetical protein
MIALQKVTEEQFCENQLISSGTSPAENLFLEKCHLKVKVKLEGNMHNYIIPATADIIFKG